MDETILTLKPGVTLSEQDGQTSLVLDGHVQYAKDERQIKILRALILHSQPLETLIALLHTRDAPSKNDNDHSLAIAEFILDFGEFLKA